MARESDSGVVLDRSVRLKDVLRADRLDLLVLRSVAIVLLIFALMYWARLTGVMAGEDYRFDTMGRHWRLAALVMAVALPITALGLWSATYWGVVLWIPVAAVELLMYGWFSDLFGSSATRIAFHLLALALYTAIVFAQRYWLTKGENTSA